MPQNCSWNEKILNVIDVKVYIMSAFCYHALLIQV